MLDLEHYYDPTLPEPIVSTALTLPDPFAPDHIPMRNPPAEGGVDIAGVTVTALKPSSPNPFDYAIFVNAQNSAALLALQDRFVFNDPDAEFYYEYAGNFCGKHSYQNDNWIAVAGAEDVAWQGLLRNAAPGQVGIAYDGMITQTPLRPPNTS